ncbi:MAG: hypothetical protein ACYSUP_11740 [Planctomycetota bacterium]|jgi:hypothetical protein
MSEIGKKLNFPRTSEAGPEATQRYARKLTRTLDDMRNWLVQTLKSYIDEQINNLTLGVGDHGELTGLEDIQDHLYAFLVNGTRKFTGHGDGFSNDTLLADADQYAAVSEYAIKAYVDALLAYILAAPVGTVIYVWEDYEGQKHLERLIPGEYGQVLTTAGANHRPFWAWVYEEPGAVFSGEIWFRAWMDAYPSQAQIITMDVLKTITPSGFNVVRRDNVLHPTRFTAYDVEQTASVNATSIITMDQAKQIQATMSGTAETNPRTVVLYDTIALTDAVAMRIALKATVNDSVGLSDVPEANIILGLNVNDSLNVTDYAEASVA